MEACHERPLLSLEPRHVFASFMRQRCRRVTGKGIKAQACTHRTLEKLKSSTLGPFGKAGERQSNTMAVSLNTSAASLYILHSGSKAVNGSGISAPKLE